MRRIAEASDDDSLIDESAQAAISKTADEVEKILEDDGFSVYRIDGVYVRVDNSDTGVELEIAVSDNEDGSVDIAHIKYAQADYEEGGMYFVRDASGSRRGYNEDALNGYFGTLAGMGITEGDLMNFTGEYYLKNQ